MVSALAVLGAGGLAFAQDTYTTPPPPQPVYEAPPPGGEYVISPYADGAASSYAWTAPGLMSGIGVAVEAGGGVSGFVENEMRDVTSDVQGLWNLRVIIGSHIPIGLEVGYVGTASRIDALVGPQSGDLIGTTVEGALRWNILPHLSFNPYLFGGVGWQRYDVTNANFHLADNGMNDSDDLVEFPMGVGLSWRSMTGLTVDVRGTFRAMTDQNLVLENNVPVGASFTNSDSFVPMHSWAANASIGYEW